MPIGDIDIIRGDTDTDYIRVVVLLASLIDQAGLDCVRHNRPRTRDVDTDMTSFELVGPGPRKAADGCFCCGIYRTSR